jgi:hypothetical protein
MRPEEQQVEVPKREKKPAQDFVRKDPPRPPWKPEFDILQNEHQNPRSRSRPPAFGNHFQFAAREFFQPVQSNAAVISWVLMKRVAERCDQTEISAVC